jgi:branched-chain amino acid transport system ATP-binding protein
MTTLLRLGGLSAGYGPVEVLHKIDLEVQEHEVTVILGANGAGKTTTMRAISGMIPRKGAIEFNGQNIAKRSPDAIVRLGIAQVPQGRGTFTDLTVDDNLRAGAFVRRDRHVDHDIALWYETFPRLRERHAQKAGTLSGGEQQMLAIARALMSRPRLLLCDEPSLGLAPLITKELFQIIKKQFNVHGRWMRRRDDPSTWRSRSPITSACSRPAPSLPPVQRPPSPTTMRFAAAYLGA